MGLHETPLLFDFEVASSENLTFIPMAVRFNLDRAGRRISLAQWQRLPHEDRRLLARFPVDDDASAEFAHALGEMLRTHMGEGLESFAESFAPDLAPAWRDVQKVPAGVLHQAQLAGVAAPGVDQWARLAPFPRYVLAKLSRKREPNHDFMPALREFGLA